MIRPERPDMTNGRQYRFADHVARCLLLFGRLSCRTTRLRTVLAGHDDCQVLMVKPASTYNSEIVEEAHAVRGRKTMA